LQKKRCSSAQDAGQGLPAALLRILQALQDAVQQYDQVLHGAVPPAGAGGRALLQR
jgi:hypothetical protein